MSIRVEFYGVARIRSGVESLAIELDKRDALTLRDALAAIVDACPQLRGDCIDDGRLQASFAANLDGDTFVSDPSALIRDGQSLLILSADAGG